MMGVEASIRDLRVDVFSTESLSIHHKIFIGLKNLFDLHKLR